MGELWTVMTVAGLVITLAMLPPVISQLRKHPNGLHILFVAEMWERFSYYGMRALLIFYLTQHFLFDDSFSSSQYAAYVTLIYFTPLIGGFLADRLMGTRKAIGYGALLLVFGHSLMAVEGEPAEQVLVVGEQRITLEAEGRGDARRVLIPQADTVCELNPSAEDAAAGGCAVNATPDGALAFSNLPAGATLPSQLEPGTYSFEVEGREPLIVKTFYLALAFIIMGVGFLKANISAMVGQLYDQGDPRRDSGFTLYYFGINLGAFWASILCGLLGETYGWSYGFGAAGLGMLLGFLVFWRRRLLFFIPGPAQLPDHVGDAPSPAALKKAVLGPLTVEHMIYIGGLLGVGIVWVLVQSPPAAILAQLQGLLNAQGAHIHITALLLPVTLALLGYLAYFMVTECTRVQRDRLILALLLISLGPFFWALFEQAGASLNLFAGRNTQLPDNGFFTIKASQVQSFNSGFILLFAPVFAALWAFLGRRNLDPNPLLKFAIAMVQVGLGFWVLVLGAQFADAAYRVPLIFLALLYLLHTTGELCLSPVGMSAVTKLSPVKVFSLMMAAWFLGIAWAGQAVGVISTLVATETVAGAVLDPKAALETSVSVFWQVGLLAIILGVVIGAASFVLKRLAHDGVIEGEGEGAPAGQAPAEPKDTPSQPQA